MANRIAGNVLIIDSAMGNNLVILDTQYKNYNVTAYGFWAADSTAAFRLTGTDTAADIIIKHDFPAGASNAIENPRWFSFGAPHAIGVLKAPVVTSGTAFLYLV